MAWKRQSSYDLRSTKARFRRDGRGNRLNESPATVDVPPPPSSWMANPSSSSRSALLPCLDPMINSKLSSVVVNKLVFRYLLESGFTHTAFIFGHEANLVDTKIHIDGGSIPVNALVTFLQKGFQYAELEANACDNDVDAAGDFIFVHPDDLLTTSVDDLKRAMQEKKQKSSQEVDINPHKTTQHGGGHGDVDLGKKRGRKICTEEESRHR